jgi:hypothetical protein
VIVKTPPAAVFELGDVEVYPAPPFAITEFVLNVLAPPAVALEAVLVFVSLVPPIPTTTGIICPGVTDILFLQASAPPPPPPPPEGERLPPPPAPTATTDTEVTPSGTVKFPEDKNSCCCGVAA